MPAGPATASTSSTPPVTACQGDRGGHRSSCDSGRSKGPSPSPSPSSPDDPTSARFRASVQRLDSILLAHCHSDRALRDAWPQLKGVKSSLDSGKSVSGAGTGRGLPLRIVVQTLKSSWHIDQTWPVEEEARQNKTATGPSGVGKPELGPPVRPDPSPETVAQGYRARGVHVGDPVMRAETGEEADGW